MLGFDYVPFTRLLLATFDTIVIPGILKQEQSVFLQL
jgi:hypothetical protein